jgi:diguanylate cyclase (GGDEF)-like protein/PAS domain S-box-containing protein
MLITFLREEHFMSNKEKTRVDMLEKKDYSSETEYIKAIESIIDNMPFNTWFKDKNGRYIAVNNDFEVYAGMPREKIIGKTDSDIYPKEEAEVYIASDNSVIEGKSQGYFESIVNGKWKEEYKKAAFDDKGVLIGTTGFSRDITKRKQIEEELKESERSKAVLVSNLPGVAYRCLNDGDWTMTFLSEGCLELTGYEPEELIGNKKVSYNELISPIFKNAMYLKWKDDIAGNLKSSDEYTIITKTGEVKWVWDQSVGVYGKDGTLSESEGFIMDITESKRAIESLNEREDRFRTVFEKAPLGIGIFNTNTGFVYQVNHKFAEILGRPIEDLYKLDWKSYSHPDEIDENISKLNLLQSNKIVGFSMNKRYFKKDGSIVWVNMTIAPFKEESIQDMHLCMIEDITEKKKREEEINYISYHDVLTGLYNRTFFEEEKMRLDMSRKFPISVIMGDVNGLKLMNDSFGHAKGDELLKEIANILKSTCRGDDIIARIGGDEFVILMTQTDSQGAKEACARIYNECQNFEKNRDRKTYYLSISLGYATKSKEGNSMDDLIKEAETMLYIKKNQEKEEVNRNVLEALKK